MARTGRTDRVLLIDDDRMSRDVLAILLDAEGYQVECASSGEFAVERLRESPTGFAVVLADVQMPGLAGVELAAALRELGGPEIVLLAMSGSEVPERIAAAFSGCLLKPFEVADLAEVIARCRATLRRARPNDDRLTHASPAVPGTLADATRASQYGMDPQGYPAAPLLDERIYGQLGDSMTPAQLRQMYGLCLDDVRLRIAEMRRLVEGRQSENFSREAHAIKGGCGMLGASELYRMAAELERAGLGAAGLDGSPGVNPLDELAAACDRLERMLATRT